MKPLQSVAGLISAILLFAPAHSHASNDPNKDKIQSILDRGGRLVQSKQYDKAIEEYQKALQVDPKSRSTLLALGSVSVLAGKYDKAEEYTQSLIQIEPSYPAYKNMAIILANQSRFEEAVDFYKKALEFSPTSYGGWYQLGLVYAALQHYPEAIDAYQNTLKYNPAYSDAYLGLGSAYFKSGDKAKALEQVSKLKGLKKEYEAQALENWITHSEASGSESPPKP